MLVVTAVSSMNTRRAGSSMPCSRTQLGGPSHVGSLALCRLRLFFAVIHGSEDRGTETGCGFLNSPLVQHRNDLIQREVRLLTDEGEYRCEYFSNGEILPPRASAWKSRHREALHPPDCRTDAHVETARLPSRRDAPSSTKRMTRTLSSPGYGPCLVNLRRINALDSLLRRALGIPIHPAGRCCSARFRRRIMSRTHFCERRNQGALENL